MRRDGSIGASHEVSSTQVVMAIGCTARLLSSSDQMRLSTTASSSRVSVPALNRVGLRLQLSVCRSGLSEDVLARLKAAEEEAAMLRKELAAAKARAQPVFGSRREAIYLSHA